MGYKRADCITLQSYNTAVNFADATDYYMGAFGISTTADLFAMLAPRDGVIKYAAIYSYATTTGTAESWTFNLRVETTNNFLGTVAAAAARRVWINDNLEIPVSKGDLIQFHTLTPTWATKPESFRSIGIIILTF